MEIDSLPSSPHPLLQLFSPFVLVNLPLFQLSAEIWRNYDSHRRLIARIGWTIRPLASSRSFGYHSSTWRIPHYSPTGPLDFLRLLAFDAISISNTTVKIPAI